MKEALNQSNKEIIYEKFDTDETFTKTKKFKKINFATPQLIIKYILITFVLLCFIFLLFNLTKNKNIITISELKPESKKVELPLSKTEVKLIENKISLDYSIKGSFITNQRKEEIILITIYININKKCPKENCFECYTNEEINYPELTEKEAFNKIYKEMDLRNTFVKNVYCQNHNPEYPKGIYKNLIHFVWNNFKRKMIPINGLYFIKDSIAKKYNNEYLQSVIQGYNFTIMDHIYEKNNKNYKYNDITLNFDEIKLDIKCQKNYQCVIGSNEKCNSCDSTQNEFCDSCNEGYYLSNEDKTQCKKLLIDGEEINHPELSETETFNKIYKEMNLHDTYVNKVYYQKPNSENPKNYIMMQKHFVWNNYKRKIIPIKGLYYIDNDIAKTYNDEYLQSVLQGYEFTVMDHVYEKNKKFYQYNDITLKFDEITLY